MVFDPSSAAEIAKKEENSRIAGKTGVGWLGCIVGVCLFSCTGTYRRDLSAEDIGKRVEARADRVCLSGSQTVAVAAEAGLELWFRFVGS